eukprot:473883-Prorocentrum_minimum.AAC.3
MSNSPIWGGWGFEASLTLRGLLPGTPRGGIASQGGLASLGRRSGQRQGSFKRVMSGKVRKWQTPNFSFSEPLQYTTVTVYH